MKQRLTALTVFASAALIMTACSSSGGGVTGAGERSSAADMTSAPAPTSSVATSESSAVAPTSSSAASSAATPKQVTVNKTVTDPILGTKFTILSWMRGYQLPEATKQKYVAFQDAEIILVQVRVTTGTKFYITAGEDDFRLTHTKNGIDVSPDGSILGPVIAEQSHLQPLEDAERGKTSTGWVAFASRNGNVSSPVVFRYERLAYGTSDGKNIPKQNFDTTLPIA